MSAFPAPITATQKPTALVVLRDNWGWFAFVAAILVLFYFLGPILAPFAVGATFAYMGDPIVDRLERFKMSRTVAVCLVFAVVSTVFTVALLLLVPLLQQQVVSLLENIPNMLLWVQQVAMPKLGLSLPRGIKLDADGLRKVIASHWDGASDFATIIFSYVGQSTPVLLGFLANLFLIPIVTFYLLRDWDVMVIRIRDLIPRGVLPQSERFAEETNDVLSALIRGQLLVMLALASIYSLGLWLVGLKVALLIGIVAGLVSFVPYLGFAAGLVAASVAMLVQEQALLPMVWVMVVFGIGAGLENAVLVPLLVGDRIGLHPVAVIFAILAGGQLFGFVGVLVALPVAAVLAVMFRHALRRWAVSPLYLDTHGAVPISHTDTTGPTAAP